MARIPVRFKRVVAAFDEEARARLYESSGSEHSAETCTDLSHLVNSFLENEEGLGDPRGIDQMNDGAEDSDESSERNCSDSDIKDSLKRLLNCQVDEVKRQIHTAVEKASREVVGAHGSSTVDFKRRLMVRLRDRGLDAGFCKSKWEKVGHCPSGDYEYIDVYVAGTRYFVEVALAKEFAIAKPTGRYTSLLNIFPQIFVGKEDELKQVTRLMCSAIKKSMKKIDIHLPPWRRLGYMQAKWFGSYKRTTNELSPAQKAFDSDEDDLRRRKRSVGFVPVPTISFPCREDFSTKCVGGFRVGNLAAELNGNSVLS
ncbi:uncharacterized protein LOC113782966 [Coffea eugenioides]|uniref:uncharacterized protein LOC113782966 n=1 Tax=Coffea eugenioides TaxID=49369 RepID=UPI000F605025|nr:uncharacterized protein LOC113782966 [Coffea eugenioides]